jgi:hypothetical protein
LADIIRTPRSLRGELMIVMRNGQHYRCQNPECRAEIEVRKDSIEGLSNPVCCCGAAMKRTYTKPVFRELDKDEAPFVELFERRGL